MANPAVAERVGISGEQCRKHLESLRAYRGRDVAGFTSKIQAIYEGHQFDPQSDPDLMLYSGGFFGEQDKRVMEQVRSQSPEELAAGSFVFEDQRLPEMLFRYRARNYPHSLSGDEREHWEEFRYQRLTEPDAAASLTMDAFQAEIEQLIGQGELSSPQQALLDQLMDYADTLLA